MFQKKIGQERVILPKNIQGFGVKERKMQTTPWHNYALITFLAGKNISNLGKTKLQKLVFFMKAVKNIPVDYSYRFYTYGPYCDELSGDISYLEAVNALDISSDINGFGFVIREGEKSAFMKNKARDFLAKFENDINDIIEKFKNKNANEMELLSTIVYLNKREDVCRANKKCLVERIRELKPHFSLSKIQSGIDELSSFGYLN
jgi:uncharacterized protein YwgA